MTLAGAVGAAAPPAPAWCSRHRNDAIWCGCAAALAVVVFWLAHAGLGDDGYITLDYARTLAVHGTWGLTSQLQSNTATSPLNVLLLAMVMAGCRIVAGGPHPVAALGVVTVAALTATAWWLIRITHALRIPASGRALGIAVLLLSPLALSAIGLETALLVALLLGLVSEAIRARPLMFGLLAGLALLTRLDAVVFVVVLGLGSATVRRRWWRALAPMLLVTVPWFVWSWTVLGSAIPDTLAIKQLQVYPGGWSFAGGLVLFLRDSFWPAIVSLLPAALGLLALLAWLVARSAGRVSNRLAPAALFAVAGVGYFGAYCALAVPPYLWYYVPTLAALDAFFVVALARFVRHRPAGMSLGLVLALAPLVTDLLHGLPWHAPPIFGNYAEPADYARVGEQMRPMLAGAAVESPGELGTLVFYCHCEVTDQFSDPGRALPFIEAQTRAAAPTLRWALALNYHRLDRCVRPVPVRYHLVWGPGWVRQRPGVWDVSSPASGKGHLTLYPVAG
ncbi:MAG: hypothetical protein ACRDRN_24660 [Sciscionella sp.]